MATTFRVYLNLESYDDDVARFKGGDDEMTLSRQDWDRLGVPRTVRVMVDNWDA